MKTDKFAANLRLFRMQRGLTQTELARRIDVTPPSVSNWESGIRKPDYEKLEAIADVLNVSIDELMGVTSSEESEIDGLLEYLKNRPEGKLLFKTLKGCTTEDIIRAVAIIDALKKNG